MHTHFHSFSSLTDALRDYYMLCRTAGFRHLILRDLRLPRKRYRRHQEGRHLLRVVKIARYHVSTHASYYPRGFTGSDIQSLGD